MFPENVFMVSRIILFFIATPFVYRALQSIDLSKVFKPDASDEIRFVLMVTSVILGFLFVDALVSLFEFVNNLF